MSFKTFLVWLVIIASGLFIYLKVSSLGDENSYFNQTTRYKLGRYSFIRTALSLHKDGDARTDFLTNKKPMVIEVVRARNVEIPAGALDDFAAAATKYLGRNVKLVTLDVFQEGVIAEKDLGTIVKKYRRHSSFGESNLFVIYTQDFEGHEQEIARTYQEFGVLMSADRISQFTSSYPQSRRQYVASTLLHELGHQLGLGHVNNPNCIMNGEVDSPTAVDSFSGTYTATEFCGEELRMLESIKKSVQ